MTPLEAWNYRKNLEMARKAKRSKMPNYNFPGREAYREHASLPMTGIATKHDTPQYTGSAMIGIATLHKSNAVPVFSSEEAESISKMRRG